MDSLWWYLTHFSITNEFPRLEVTFKDMIRSEYIVFGAQGKINFLNDAEYVLFFIFKLIFCL